MRHVSALLLAFITILDSSRFGHIKIKEKTKPLCSSLQTFLLFSNLKHVRLFPWQLKRTHKKFWMWKRDICSSVEYFKSSMQTQPQHWGETILMHVLLHKDYLSLFSLLILFLPSKDRVILNITTMQWNTGSTIQLLPVQNSKPSSCVTCQYSFSAYRAWSY